MKRIKHKPMPPVDMIALNEMMDEIAEKVALLKDNRDIQDATKKAAGNDPTAPVTFTEFLAALNLTELLQTTVSRW